ncbi:MAG: hypothetical protein IT180_16740 [Acidobacteria bacterium]|nr:hypothetical protein [Acidobacteriota bacterium]
MRRECVVVAAFLALAVPVAGQGGARPPAERPADLNPGAIQRLFDAMLVADAQQALELTDKQFPDFLIRLRALQETRRRNLLQRVRLMADIQRLSNPRNPQPDEGALQQQLTALQELESRSAAELRRAYNAIDEVLDVRQQARFRLLEEQVERRKIELLMRARQNRAQQRRLLPR